jgi:hypothetical protein
MKLFFIVAIIIIVIIITIAYTCFYKKNMVIVSLTTSPRRIHLLKDTIDSFLNQTVVPDLIQINIPKVFKRTGETYEIPEFLKNNERVKINLCDRDYGPIMKILPTILDENYENSTIIYTDDDVLMLPKTIENYLTSLKINPNFVYCLSGFQYNFWINKQILFPGSGFVDVPEGFMSVCLSSEIIKKIRPSILDYFEEISQNEYCFTSDDLTMGNFLAMNDIKTFKIFNDEVNGYLWWISGCELDYGKKSDAIQNIASDQHFTRYKKALEHLRNIGLQYIYSE